MKKLVVYLLLLFVVHPPMKECLFRKWNGDWVILPQLSQEDQKKKQDYDKLPTFEVWMSGN